MSTLYALIFKVCISLMSSQPSLCRRVSLFNYSHLLAMRCLAVFSTQYSLHYGSLLVLLPLQYTLIFTVTWSFLYQPVLIYSQSYKPSHAFASLFPFVAVLNRHRCSLRFLAVHFCLILERDIVHRVCLEFVVGGTPNFNPDTVGAPDGQHALLDDFLPFVRFPLYFKYSETYTL